MQLLIHQHLPDGTKDGNTNAATGSLGGGSGNAAKRQKHDADDGQVCLGCGATSTPEWRRGPMGKDDPLYVFLNSPLILGDLGPRTLCNACGLVYAKMVRVLILPYCSSFS